MINELRDYYQTLYSNHYSEEGEEGEEFAFLENPNIPSLSNNSKMTCEGLLTCAECFEALKKKCPCGKTPGNDGLTAEFYKTFWNLLGQQLTDSLNYSFEHGELSSSQTVMAARRVSEAPTIKGNFALGFLQRSVSLPDIWRPLTSEYFTHKKQELRLGLIDTRPGSSLLPANSDGRNGGNTKSCTSEFKDKIVPLTEKEIENLTISALKDELGKRKLSKKGNKQILVSRLKSSLQSTSQKTSAVSD